MAHSRRRRENDTFTDMAEVLPIQENAKDLDKASILRVAINFLKLRDLVGDKDVEDDTETEKDGPAADHAGDCGGVTVKTEDTTSEIGNDNAEKSISLPNFAKDVLQALDGFMLVISSDGRILYTSESISAYLGLRQVDVIGISISDIIHPQDITELATIFKTQGKDSQHVFDRSNPLKRNFVVRMRCAFTPSVRSIARCSNFKPIYCSASLKFGRTEQTRGKFQGVVALCKLASVSRIREMCVGAFFKTKHSLDLGYIGIDTRIRWILGYDPTEMMGHKAYQYFHPQDLTATSSCHMNLLSQGHSHSPCYRFMSRWGDWLWVRSKSYVTYNPISHMPDGLLIYTWIVRLEEDDDRMKAIQAGKAAVEKEYGTLGSSISTEGGTLDITKLADPNAAPKDSEQPETVTTLPKKTSRPAVIEKKESGYLSSASSYPSPNNSQSSAMPSPPLSVATPPDSATYNTAQQLTNGVCGSPESQPNSCQSSLNAGQTGYFGSTQSLHRSTMPSPPYTPYDQSPPQPSQQFVDPYLVGTSFQQYQGFNPDPMAPVSNGYGPQYSQQQQQQPGMYGNSSGLPQCPLPGQGVVQMPTQLDRCNVNPATLEMQATVFTTSPSSSTICYQPPNLTDLQFPSEQPQAFPGFDTMPSSSNGAMNASVANPVNRVYVNNARERYNVTCGAAPSSVHVGSKRQRENLSSQAPGISEWSSQWHQGSAPRAHVY